MEAAYNDIGPWHFKDLVKAFGAQDGKYKTFQVKTKEQVHELFKDEEFNSAKYLQFVEVYIPWDDAPRALKLTAESSAKRNAKIE